MKRCGCDESGRARRVVARAVQSAGNGGVTRAGGRVWGVRQVGGGGGWWACCGGEGGGEEGEEEEGHVSFGKGFLLGSGLDGSLG